MPAAPPRAWAGWGGVELGFARRSRTTRSSFPRSAWECRVARSACREWGGGVDAGTLARPLPDDAERRGRHSRARGSVYPDARRPTCPRSHAPRGNAAWHAPRAVGGWRSGSLGTLARPLPDDAERRGRHSHAGAWERVVNGAGAATRRSSLPLVYLLPLRHDGSVAPLHRPVGLRSRMLACLLGAGRDSGHPEPQINVPDRWAAGVAVSPSGNSRLLRTSPRPGSPGSRPVKAHADLCPHSTWLHTNQGTIPARCHACRTVPIDWLGTNRPWSSPQITDFWRRRCKGNLPSKFASSTAQLVAERRRLVVPARQAYSHSASVGNRYSHDDRSRSARRSDSVSLRQNSTVSLWLT